MVDSNDNFKETSITNSVATLSRTSFRHLKKWIENILDEQNIDSHVWEPILLDICCEIAQDVPFILEILDNLETKNVNHTVVEDNNKRNRGKQQHHYNISIKLIDETDRSQSHYVPGIYEEEENGKKVVKGQEQANSSSCPHNVRELGGTILLYGPQLELQVLKPVVDLLIFASCHLKLEDIFFHELNISRDNDFTSHLFKSFKKRQKRLTQKVKGWWQSMFSSFDSHSKQSSVSSEEEKMNPPASAISLQERFNHLQTKPISLSPNTVFPEPFLLKRLIEDEQTPIGKNKRISFTDTEQELIRYSQFIDSPGVVPFCRDRTLWADAKSALLTICMETNLQALFEHQRLSTVYYLKPLELELKELKPCTSYKQLNFIYYDSTSGDQTMEVFLDTMYKNAYTKCEICGLNQHDHIIHFAHATYEMSISTAKTSLPQYHVDENTDLNTCKNIKIKLNCPHCHFMSTFHTLSQASSRLSFAKFMELAFYCEDLRHNCTNHYSVTRNISFFNYQVIYLDFTFTISVKNICLYELRVPKIQFSPHLSFVTSHQVLYPENTLFPFGFDAPSILSDLKTDVDTFYTSAIKIVHRILEEIEKRSGKPHLNTHNDKAKRTISDLLKSLEEGGTVLIEKIEQQQELNCLNNSRRMTYDAFNSIKNTVIVCIEEFAPSLSTEISNSFVFPLYMCSDDTLVFPDSNVLVRLNEPTSLISYMLSSKSYCSILSDLHTEQDMQKLLNKSLERRSSEFSESLKIISNNSSLITNISSPKGYHLQYNIETKRHKFSCTLYYSKEFDKLRRMCDISSMFVCSLSRCKSCKFSGGKSRASFFLTHDNEFVVKQLTKKWTQVEKDDLLAFAPQYFDYIENSQENATVLSKIFGFYTIQHDDLVSGQSTTMDLLISEYLFGDENVTKKFDLKGASQRQSMKTDVLLDADFIEGQWKSFIPLHAFSKTYIMDAIQRDTEFLASCNIMDYSLLVGILEDTLEVIVGIVDFLGPYTWYKRLETTGKITIMGECTVIPPLEYKKRFCCFLDNHLLMVPDKWTPIQTENVSSPLPPVL